MSDCVPTKTDASDAALVDAGDVADSAVLEARLTTDGKGLSGKTMAESFRAVFDGEGKYCGSRDEAEVEVARGP